MIPDLRVNIHCFYCREVGTIIKDKFDGATEVAVVEEDSKPMMVRKNVNFKRHTKADLVNFYLLYCLEGIPLINFREGEGEEMGLNSGKKGLFVCCSQHPYFIRHNFLQACACTSEKVRAHLHFGASWPVWRH